MLLPHVLPHAKRVYQQLRSLTRRVVVDSGGISGALHLCHGSGRCHQDENIFYCFLLLIFCGSVCCILYFALVVHYGSRVRWTSLRGRGARASASLDNGPEISLKLARNIELIRSGTLKLASNRGQMSLNYRTDGLI